MKTPTYLFFIPAFLFLFVWINSFIGTTDYANWWIENILTFLTVIALLVSYKYYKFSAISYVLIFLFLAMHVYGSKYTYADNLFGYWCKETLQLKRNPYDRMVHFAFGFLLYFPLKELFITVFKYPKSLAFCLPIVLILALAGGFEVIEWMVADVFFKEHGESYLGTQGDIWDAQKDIALAFVGSVLAAIIFIKKSAFK